jgi:radical SAM superfamily enzyme YgiQ (UPF0313 family)
MTTQVTVSVAGVRVLLVSTYELGHQPLHVASPAAALAKAGHQPRCLDLSVQRWDREGAEAVDWAEAVAFSVPMHTAMRLAVAAARDVRRRRPQLPLCFYGLYAPMADDPGAVGLADRAIAGEYEPGLVEWVGDVAADGGSGTSAGASRLQPVSVELGRGRFSAPARQLLPPLGRYARLAVDAEERTVGYVEASHGCAHRCRHCPVPVVYDGRTRLVGEDVVVADVGALVAMGAHHVTFGDPDFLNGPHHSLRVVRAVHEHFPRITFDCTTKVEHILAHRGVWDEMAAAGCLFVVSAFESVNDDILARLDKGHTAAQAAEAVEVLRTHGIETRPSWLPFTPWTSLQDVADILDFVARHDLVPNVDPVQFSIRLLIPHGSLLLGDPELSLGAYDAELLSYAWRSPDARVDALQSRLASIAEQAAATGEAAGATYLRMRQATAEAMGDGRFDAGDAGMAVGAASGAGRPRLTEPWFCCAEPTAGQFGSLGTAGPEGRSDGRPPARSAQASD